MSTRPKLEFLTSGALLLYAMKKCMQVPPGKHARKKRSVPYERRGLRSTSKYVLWYVPQLSNYIINHKTEDRAIQQRTACVWKTYNQSWELLPAKSCRSFASLPTLQRNFFFSFFLFLSSGRWAKVKLKLPHFHVSDTTCRVSIKPTLPLQQQLALLLPGPWACHNYN